LDQTDDTYIIGAIPTQAATITKTTETLTFIQSLHRHKSHSLFNDIQLKVDEQEKASLLQRRTFIDVATDGSYDQGSGKMSYGWVISMDQTVIASASGPAESHPNLAEPFRAEAYGLAAAAAFIDQMTAFFKINPKDHIWEFVIDNTSLIREMEYI
jgi:hypothetical protein